MNTPEMITHLASEACKFENQPANAAALLVDAASMCAVECGLDAAELVDRLQQSYATMEDANNIARRLKSH